MTLSKNVKTVAITSLVMLALILLLLITMSREVGHQTAQTIQSRSVVVEDQYTDWGILRDGLSVNETSNVKLGAFFEATTNLRARLTGIMTPTGALERAKYEYADSLVKLSGALSRYSRDDAEWPEIITFVESVQDSHDAFKIEVERYLGSEVLQVWGAIY
jgi:hypothetical protein